MELYGKMDEQVLHMVCQVLVEKKHSIGKVKRASSVKKILESPATIKSTLDETTSQCSPSQLQIYFYALKFLENAFDEAGFYDF